MRAGCGVSQMRQACRERQRSTEVHGSQWSFFLPTSDPFRIIYPCHQTFALERLKRGDYLAAAKVCRCAFCQLADLHAWKDNHAISQRDPLS